MFTGLIDDVGRIEAVEPMPEGRTLRIASRYEEVAEGESIAVNGACLTVLSVAPGSFRVAAIATTLGRTTIGTWITGRRVNLERALRVGDRFGGHIVQGHVDGVAQVVRMDREGDALLVDLALPAGLAELMVRHGSVAVDGVSLTVNDLPAPDAIQISLIDYTLRHTALGDLKSGDAVHVEADIVGKYVKNLLSSRGAQRRGI